MKNIYLQHLPPSLSPADHGAPVLLHDGDLDVTIGHVEVLGTPGSLSAALVLKFRNDAPELRVDLGAQTSGDAVTVLTNRRFDLAAQIRQYARLRHDGHVWTTLRLLAQTGRRLTVTGLNYRGVQVTVGTSSATAEW